MNRAILRDSFLSMNCRGSKFLTSAAILQANCDASKPVICSTPLLPASRACHTSSALLPTPQMSPTPVTTTRRVKLLSFRVGVDVIDSVLYGADFLRLLVRDLDFEGLLEGHHQFHRVQRVGAQVVHKRRIGRDLAFVHAQLFHDDLLYFLIYGCHMICKLLSRRRKTSALPTACLIWMPYDFALACASM